MKKLYFFLTAFCLFTSVNAQVINIPDAQFKSRLLAAHSGNSIATGSAGEGGSPFIEIDINHNGEIEVSEALMVYELDVSNQGIGDITGIQSFSNLAKLNCFGNSLTTLNLTGLNSLDKLSCGGGSFTSLKIAGLTNLTVLSCYGSSQLTQLEVSDLNNLTDLYCSNCKLSYLNLSGLPNLVNLECDNNVLTSLNLSNLPKLAYLACNSNELTSLNVSALPSLVKLDCFGNHFLKSINASGLSKLISLDCNSCGLTSLNVSGSTSLTSLICYFNPLTTLDVSDLFNLTTLNCYGCYLKILDLSGTKIKNLYCEANPNLSFLLLKGADIPFISSSFNLSNYPKLRYLCVNEDAVAYWQYNVANKGLNCQVNSYCSFTPEGTFYTLNGNTKLDINNNGCDENDTAYPNLKFSITNGTTIGGIISDTSGNYSIPVQEGTHAITPIIENPTYFNISPSSFQVTFPAATSPYTQNFCITPNGVHNDLEVAVIPLVPARPGFDAKYKVVYKNKGNQTQNGSLNLAFNDAILDFIDASYSIITIC